MDYSSLIRKDSYEQYCIENDGIIEIGTNDRLPAEEEIDVETCWSPARKFSVHVY